ncbi:MAG: RNA polymerase sigma factor, partial [Planctomycetaceae bacterium]|nr:RNA polymerase sigma factor [Planctomycetaceae bacterium]
MALWPLTSASLLMQLEDANDQQVWEAFVRLYRPAVYRFARRMGLQDADAEDAAQKVLESVSAAFRHRPPDLQRGRFRSWMAQITRHAALKMIQREQHHRGAGTSDVQLLLNHVAASDEGIRRTWRLEEQHAVYRAAAGEVRANCSPTVWAAFEQTAVVGRSPEQAAAELGVNVGVVYAS